MPKASEGSFTSAATQGRITIHKKPSCNLYFMCRFCNVSICSITKIREHVLKQHKVVAVTTVHYQALKKFQCLLSRKLPKHCPVSMSASDVSSCTLREIPSYFISKTAMLVRLNRIVKKERKLYLNHHLEVI